MSCKTYVLNIRVIKLIKLKARLKIGRKIKKAIDITGKKM